MVSSEGVALGLKEDVLTDVDIEDTGAPAVKDAGG